MFLQPVDPAATGGASRCGFCAIAVFLTASQGRDNRRASHGLVEPILVPMRYPDAYLRWVDTP
jgi:hypothetical protein